MLLWSLATSAGVAACIFVRPWIYALPLLWLPKFEIYFEEDIFETAQHMRRSSHAALAVCGLLITSWLAVMFHDAYETWLLRLAALLQGVLALTLLLFPSLSFLDPPLSIAGAQCAAISLLLCFGPIWRCAPTPALSLWLGAAFLCALCAMTREIAWGWSAMPSWPWLGHSFDRYRGILPYSCAVTALAVALGIQIPLLLPYATYVRRK